MPELPKVDEFSFVLLASLIFIFILAFAWATPQEGRPFVEEISFELTAAKGERTTFDFAISGSTTMRGINLTASGEIGSWIKFNKNNFDVEGSTIITTTLDVPVNASEGNYNGRVNIIGAGGTDSFSISLDVIGEERGFESRQISLGDFTVSYAEGTELIDSDADVRVSKSHLSSRSLSLTGTLSDERLSIVTGGNIRLVIEDTNSIGDLIVLLNGDEIYRRKVGIGELVIPVEESQIETSNIVTIKADSPGLVFWTSNFYDIAIAEFNVDYKGAFAKTFNINLSDKEGDDFKQFKLFYRVVEHSAHLPLMMIKVNSQIVYWDNPPLTLFNSRINEDMLGDPLYLREGTNTITFMFEENAVYKVADSILTVEYYE